MRTWLTNVAEKRPLGSQSEPSIGKPRVLIFHTMVGYLSGTESMFKRDGYDGTESHFGVGGKWDTGKDGTIYQWQSLDHAADANWDANAYGTSIETSDGGNPNNPWTSAQLDALIKLTVEWCRETGNPCRLISHIGDAGIGYHRLFKDWNQSGHGCPGPVREGQLREIVIPKARAILEGKPAPSVSPKPKPPTKTKPKPTKTKLSVDGIFGTKTIMELQRILRVTRDGIFGPNTRKALQRYLHVTPDGDFGPVSTRALQRHVGATVDGKWGPQTTKKIQAALNAGKF